MWHVVTHHPTSDQQHATSNGRLTTDEAMFDILDIGASGLMAQRTRMDTIAANMANANVTIDPAGDPTPYRRRFVVFAPGQQGRNGKPGVHVRSVSIDQSP